MSNDWLTCGAETNLHTALMSKVGISNKNRSDYPCRYEAMPPYAGRIAMPYRSKHEDITCQERPVPVFLMKVDYFLGRLHRADGDHWT